MRRVNRQGFVKVDLYPYSISSKLAGKNVTLSIQAKEQNLLVVYPQEYREASTRTSFACSREVESPPRLSVHPLTRCGETAPLTR